MQHWLLVRAGRRWYDQYADYMAASVAYYAPLAIIPLAYIVVTISGVIFDGVYIEAWLLKKGAGLGPELTSLIRDGVLVFADTAKGQTMPFLSVLFFSVVVIVAFNTLIGGIHQVCQVPHKGIKGCVEKCLRSAILLGILGGYVTALLVAERIFQVWESNFATVPSWGMFWFLTTVLCTVAYAVLTWYPLSLSARWRGGLAASGLLLLGQSFISAYAATAGVPGLFAAAQLVVVLLLWVYAIVCIILYGAAVAYEYDSKIIR